MKFDGRPFLPLIALGLLVGLHQALAYILSAQDLLAAVLVSSSWHLGLAGLGLIGVRVLLLFVMPGFLIYRGVITIVKRFKKPLGADVVKTFLSAFVSRPDPE